MMSDETAPSATRGETIAPAANASGASAPVASAPVASTPAVAVSEPHNSATGRRARRLWY